MKDFDNLSCMSVGAPERKFHYNPKEDTAMQDIILRYVDIVN